MGKSKYFLKNSSNTRLGSAKESQESRFYPCNIPDYVGQIASSGNRIAIQVKLHDLRHNLDRGRKSQNATFAAGDQEKGKEMLRINNKHQEALETILAKVRPEMNE